MPIKIIKFECPHCKQLSTINLEVKSWIKFVKCVGLSTIRRSTVKMTLDERLCECVYPPEDDGLATCWIHHDCTDGSCTHQDGED